MFKLKSSYKPTGDQPRAIEQLVAGLNSGVKDQVLLGVTGSGKTFSIANVIAQTQRPTLILCHNKTLAAQNYQELHEFFPENAVEYFVSYYDYFQPESYIPATDTYIEKDSDINEKIDRLRLSTTTSLMTRKDVIVIASVSCIYNLGSPAEYERVAVEIRRGMRLRPVDLMKRLTQVQYSRNDFDFKRGAYRVVGDVIDVFFAYEEYAVRLEFLADTLVGISYFNPISGESAVPKGVNNSELVVIYPAKHYITPEATRKTALEQISVDLQARIADMKSRGRIVEPYRLQQRTLHDIEMINEIGYCKGIENYSRYFDGRKPGEPPYTLMDFFAKNFLLVIDESHITLPQVRGMFNGDQARKQTLIEYGFRLPSALDNRPLNFTEFMQRVTQAIYVSATPSEYELTKAKGQVAEILIRPTGIIDPQIEVLPTKGQIEDLFNKLQGLIAKGQRALVTTLTKRMAEELSGYLKEKGLKVTYLHSDIDTLERTNVLDDLRKGNYDVLVGINLLREGLDLPEVSLVAILDADKEGFLRSRSSLIQIMGRAARHISGRVVMYADNFTDSMKEAIEEVDRRREKQLIYNKEHGITPVQITKPFRDKIIEDLPEDEQSDEVKVRKALEVDYSVLPPTELKREIKKLEQMMKYEAEVLNFEEAAKLRDKIKKMRALL
ncbi:excinuclease ABC subunit B [candidate division WWE3 bacterium RIFOXYC1_FULL_40_10]|uniref:UvrABC system protein B n=1 Tax=candidate division WWE3 bacterium RIFOXYA2_FULL_46_9 TaxID=1802636 RepID=A0A1F4W043_UNCKA|nr:MAG: excinuclease ABC subunit B [candidate division WWE3 bacterium RIFOXYB1_FULL_40_22]OGC61777.1 MAG: excinuclease ABC subunit B [candidate division WWE3 bacterium RIFOXYA1_FULL_40_11]OGC62796.1 MAG: excinuclease ABC subunit B [candidate division WWE3 bacterium RIFOXYA2_FULL_46_9]OGC65174.1 MAG: excinuclease ABC subunit B [candidate division WWE3 bacterium RIFOXYB2_FULL_41_6]OGC66160.1 MAG: excinuclease ABC subunit B [candidate division WWE3 bacterium RIFOXYC1_FULL_40_10]OGC67555.1 MAG: ex